MCDNKTSLSGGKMKLDNVSSVSDKEFFPEPVLGEREDPYSTQITPILALSNVLVGMSEEPPHPVFRYTGIPNSHGNELLLEARA
jgi:hypothetical protein